MQKGNSWLNGNMPFWRRIRKTVSAARKDFKNMRLISKRALEGGNIYVAVHANGGIGDMVRLNSALTLLQKRYPAMRFDIYAGNRQKAGFVFSALPNKEFLMWEHSFLVTRRYYHMALSALHICEPVFLKPFPQENEIKQNIQKNCHLFSDYLSRGEAAFKEIADTCAANKITFSDILCLSLGLDGAAGAKAVLPSLPANNISGKYITLHHGWDESHKIPAGGMHTKCWPAASWAAFVKEFKKEFKDIKVVHIGTQKWQAIEGVDIDLRGKTSLEEACAILKGALLHVDCDCGFVHIGNSLGVRSVVLFGPSNAGYLGYKENINICAPQCGNCWHTVPNWAEKCPKGFAAPVCMSSITAQMVVEACRKIL